MVEDKCVSRSQFPDISKLRLMAPSRPSTVTACHCDSTALTALPVSLSQLSFLLSQQKKSSLRAVRSDFQVVTEGSLLRCT